MLQAKASPGSPRGDDGGATDDGATVASGGRGSVAARRSCRVQHVIERDDSVVGTRAVASAEASPGTPCDASAFDIRTPASRVLDAPAPARRDVPADVASGRSNGQLARGSLARKFFQSQPRSECENSAPRGASLFRHPRVRNTCIRAFAIVIRGRLQRFVPLPLSSSPSDLNHGSVVHLRQPLHPRVRGGFPFHSSPNNLRARRRRLLLA